MFVILARPFAPSKRLLAALKLYCFCEREDISQRPGHCHPSVGRRRASIGCRPSWASQREEISSCFRRCKRWPRWELRISIEAPLPLSSFMWRILCARINNEPIHRIVWGLSSLMSILVNVLQDSAPLSVELPAVFIGFRSDIHLLYHEGQWHTSAW